MTENATVQSIGKSLFAQAGEDGNVYAVLDGAAVGRDLIVNLYKRQPEFHCVFPGDLEPDMAEVAPYLVELKPGAPFTDWVLAEGWGKHWGIFATSPAGILQMRGHFQALVNVFDENGKPLIFRYYDPRVLRVFLPTCDSGELAEFFGPVSVYVAETEDAESLACFHKEAGRLRRQELRLAAT
ncbi:MAG TPA: DUF4123 domain-containing protein [Phycisphaerae bacterium]|nr:DUF4123 domain-containing protein [Phycisphaerae bacterium]HUU22578.1 DUF4123 domain-containing protein [Phycisphaerae bacterium]